MNNFTKISNFVTHQFPEFIQEGYPVFTKFMEAYYEWLEQPGNIGDLSRNFYKNLDIDTTLDTFLTHFENAYLYGIPDTIKGDKRFLIKHILDVYRAKGTVQGYKLLFRLLYDEDINIYFPKDDIFSPSESVWKEAKFLEVTENDRNKTFVGNVIKGSASQTQAVVEDFIVQKVNNKIVNILYISNIIGNGFSVGEKILNYQDFGEISTISAPKIVGSFNEVQIVGGGQNFNVGDTLVAVSGSGREAEMRVASTKNGTGIIDFEIAYGGNLYSIDANIILTRQRSQGGFVTGTGASYEIAAISGIQSLTYDTGLIIQTQNNIIGSSNNLVINTTLTYETKNYGYIASLTNKNSGNNYNNPVQSDIKDFFYYPLTGQVFFSNTSNIITGSLTQFTQFFQPGNYIQLIVSQSGNTYTDYRRVVSVANDTYMTVDDNVKFSGDGIDSIQIVGSGRGYSNGEPLVFSGTNQSANITIITDSVGSVVDFHYNNKGSQFFSVPIVTVSSGIGASLLANIDIPTYSLAIPIFDAIYAPYERYDPTSNNYWGDNAVITGLNQHSSGIIDTAQIKNSGIGYAQGETITFYKSGALSDLTIVSGGVNYANNESLVFSGGSPTSIAIGYVLTNANGTIISLNMVYAGSGYYAIPSINVITANGTGATITCQINAVDQTYPVTGIVQKTGIGQEKGKWLTSKSFTSSNKYLQDSYYYQDFSYEIQAPMSFNKYVDMAKRCYHPAGLELFGKMVYTDKVLSNSILDFEFVESNYVEDQKQNFVSTFDTFFIKLWEINDGSITVPVYTNPIDDSLTYNYNFMPNFNSFYIKLWQADNENITTGI